MWGRCGGAGGVRGLLFQTNCRLLVLEAGEALAEVLMLLLLGLMIGGGLEFLDDAAHLGDGFIAGAFLLAAVALEMRVFGGKERVDAFFVEQASFLEVETEEVPGGAEVLAEGLILEFVVDNDLGKEAGLELLEVVAEVVGNDEVARGEAMFQGVLRGDGLAFGGAGSGGPMGRSIHALLFRGVESSGEGLSRLECRRKKL